MRPWRPALALALVAATALTAEAYLKLGFEVGGRTVIVRQPGTVRYFVSDRGVAGVTAAQLDQALTRAFNTWQAVPRATVEFQRVGFTAASPFDDDGATVLGFESRPDLDRVLGATSFTIDTVTGDIVEADIFFNAAFPWSVAPGGEAGRFDLESIAVHEIGHLVGLGHSAIGETELRPTGGRRVIATEAVMFPIAFPAGNIAARELRPDDIAGVSDIYPAERFRRETGSVSGRVTKAGRGLFGAHVVAFHLGTGRLVGNFALNQNGDFSISGLEPGPHVVRVEPLDDGDIESFFRRGTAVDLDFAVTFLDRVVLVPRGGNVGGLTIDVRPR
jgi:hypothetical protein